MAEYIGNLKSVFWPAHSAVLRELSIRFFFDENSSDAPANVGGVAVRTRAKDSLCGRSLDLRASGAVGLRWQAVSVAQGVEFWLT
jgi:hypothetical protein